MTHNMLLIAGIVGGVWLASFVVIYISLGVLTEDALDPELVCR